MSTRIIRSLEEVAGGYDGILCDVWGVYHNGIRVFPGASRALAEYRRKGGTVVMLTNAPRPAGEVEEAIRRLGGSTADYDAIVTSGDAARSFLAGGAWGCRAFHVGPPRNLPLVRGLSLELVPFEAGEFILCTGLFDDRSESPDDYTALLGDALARGMPMLCSNPDRFVDIGHVRVPCAGSIAAAYEAMGGRVAYYGKPYPPVYEAALDALDRCAGRCVPRERVLAIGDGILTDVPGAANLGLACVFVTGGLAASEIRHEDGAPEADGLAQFLAEHGAAPMAAMGWLS